MPDILSAIGQALSLVVLLAGAYLAVAEAIDTADNSDEDME